MQIIALKNDEWLYNQKRAGRAVHNVLYNFKDALLKKSVSTLLDLERKAENVLRMHCCTATFKGYQGFPGSVCLSVNNVLVHGIPSSYKLQEGDVVTMDVGATFNGAIADAAYTEVFGGAQEQAHKDLLSHTYKALQIAQEKVVVGNRLGTIGHAIFEYGSKNGYGVITNYGGHGLDTNKPHAPPFVANKMDKNLGIRMQPGLAIAIEPMFVMGQDTSTVVGDDGWSVSTKTIGAHFEHSITVALDGQVHKITDYNLGSY